MSKVAKEIQGKIEGADGSLVPFLARIFEPVRSEGHKDFYCIVHCPYFFGKDKFIFGVDAAQALGLAGAFLNEIMKDATAIISARRDRNRT